MGLVELCQLLDHVLVKCFVLWLRRTAALFHRMFKWKFLALVHTVGFRRVVCMRGTIRVESLAVLVTAGRAIVAVIIEDGMAEVAGAVLTD